jgi:TetR/AcrR family transcriptional regulator, fatty acid metabolism regulator protein
MAEQRLQRRCRSEPGTGRITTMADHGKKKTRKERIMEAALHIFSEKGFQNTTITEISKEAGVSEATIYGYFGTKEDLLIAIPEKISNDAAEEMSRHLPYIKGAEGRLRVLLQGYTDLYQSNPDYSALVLLQLMSNKRFRQTAAHEAIRRSAHGVLECIREGIADGTFREDVNPYIVRSMLLGAIEHVFIQWHMEGRPERTPSSLNLLDSIIDIVLDGIRFGKEDSHLTLRLDLESARKLGKLLQAQGILEDEKREDDRRASLTKKIHKKEHVMKGAVP